MYKLIAFVVLLFTSLAFAKPLRSGGFNARNICGTHISSEKRIQVESYSKEHAITPAANANPIVFNVRFHVISEDDTPEGGNIPDSQVVEQIEVLNENFDGTGISFQLIDTTRTINEDWFNNVEPGTSEQKDMKGALHVGGPLDLNIYTVGSSEGGFTGYSTFPWDYRRNSVNDGIVIHFSTLPGGTLHPYNLGKILVHEAGHWVGLYHTFQGGCRPPGDFVDDTPAESSPAFGCPIGRKSCKDGNNDNVDPIDNHMDYTSDSCRDNFTPGQIARFNAQITTYRLGV